MTVKRDSLLLPDVERQFGGQTLNQTTNRIGIVAIVDDDADIRQALASLLMASSFTIGTFSTAEAFLQFPHRKEVRCLILDVHLPGMNGVDLQKRLLEAGEKVPVIFISANGNNSVRDLAMKAGASAFLHKPVRAKTLLHEIEAALKSLPAQS